MTQSDLPDDRQQPTTPPRPDGGELGVSPHSTPIDVPVFSCIVLVSADPDGGVRARVANLAGLECKAATERAALAKVVPAFKQRVAELWQAETPIPWIDPPLTAAPEEQRRFIPVHL